MATGVHEVTTAEAPVIDTAGVDGSQPRALDQFFTHPAAAASSVRVLKETLLGRSFDAFACVLEPSFGSGVFLRALLEHGPVKPERLRYVDIDAKDPEHRADFLKDDLHIDPALPCLTVGGPPFGRNASLAVAFFNRAATFSRVVAFVVPRTFRKASLFNRLDRRFFLVRDVDIEHRFSLGGRAHAVPCAFQIWARADYMYGLEPPYRLALPSLSTLRPEVELPRETADFCFVRNPNEAHLAIRRVGVNAGRIFDEKPPTLAERNERSHHYVRILTAERQEQVIQALRALDLEHASCKFNTAGSPSLAQTEICALYDGQQHGYEATGDDDDDG